MSEPVVKDTPTVKLTLSQPTASGSPGSGTVTVTGLSSLGTPTGTVKFVITSQTGTPIDCDTGNTLTLSGGMATCTISSALKSSGSPYSIYAIYLGDANYAANTSKTKSFVVP
jgi:hypothetical protein